MFLALNEIMHSKLRYALVAGVMFLIAYLVFFGSLSIRTDGLYKIKSGSE
ncbi:hypothetical protein N8B33_09975 [Enterococcus faecium]